MREMKELDIKQIFLIYNNPKCNADRRRLNENIQRKSCYNFFSLQEALKINEKWGNYYNKASPISLIRTSVQHISKRNPRKRVLQHCMKFLSYFPSSVARFYGVMTKT